MFPIKGTSKKSRYQSPVTPNLEEELFILCFYVVMGWVCDVDKKIKNKKSKHLGLNRQTYIAV